MKEKVGEGISKRMKMKMQKMLIHTKDKGVQAFVGHVFVDKHLLLSLNATTKKLN